VTGRAPRHLPRKDTAERPADQADFLAVPGMQLGEAFLHLGFGPRARPWFAPSFHPCAA
jgi:hypothetical protein